MKASRPTGTAESTATALKPAGLGYGKKKHSRKWKQKLQQKIKQRKALKLKQAVPAAAKADYDEEEGSKKKEPAMEAMMVEDSEVTSDHAPVLDMSMWESLGVCQEIIASLREMGYAEPTAIQREAIPAALRDRRNVLGAAETGSGKTLAFGIPVIQRIMAMKAEADAKVKEAEETGEEGGAARPVAEDNDHDEEDDEQADQSPDEGELAEFGWADGEVEEDLELLAGSLTELGPDGRPVETQVLRFNVENAGGRDGGEKEDEEEEEGEMKGTGRRRQRRLRTRGDRRLYCLVLTPTRELAKQVAAHLERAAAWTGVTVAAVLGGLSAQRQERLLSAGPDIVVGTPGRLWDLLQAGQPHLAAGLAAGLPLLVLDEADRMTEPGRFAELRALLDRLNATPRGGRRDGDGMAAPGAVPARQTLLFSATLTFAHRPPDRKRKRRLRQLEPQDRAAALSELVGMTSKPKMVDTTRRVEGLTEGRLNCEAKDKDLYLWWLLRGRRGRTLVFCASKDTVRRLHRLLAMLRCPCNPLHSDMQQRQRLKSLDRFSGNSDAVLLATDVAARGLDIPGVEHVVHYQVPKVSELYLHRCGRTARASRAGTAVALVSPDEAGQLRRILRGLERDDLPLLSAPPAHDELAHLRPALNAARALETEEHRLLRQHAKRLWFERTAAELDLEPDLPELHDHRADDEGIQASNHLALMDRPAKKRMEVARAQLARVLAELGGANSASASASVSATAVSSASTVSSASASGLALSLKYPTVCAAVTTSRGTEYLQQGGGRGRNRPPRKGVRH